VDLIGLTGGIGSGKSTVSSMLAARGFAVVDADEITRDLQRPGQPVLAAMVAEFGDDIILPDGELDRGGLAERVFADVDQLARLNAIVHPAVGSEIQRRLDELSETDQIVFLDVPLLVESGRDDLDLLIVVDVDPELAVRRLVEHRGFSEHDARARISRQADRHERLAHADIVIDNSGFVADLERQLEDVIRHLTSPTDPLVRR
jgi:dephospho-CoA kinase